MTEQNERIRVIIVEDDREMREGLELIVQLNPALECIATCSSGEEALETIPDHIPDIVLMDIHLPGR
jgi:YesN/AraC family two-component response regulator